MNQYPPLSNPESTVKCILQRLRKVRLINGYSQEYLGLELGISTKAYSKIENGESKLTVERYLEICKLLNINPGELFSGDFKI